MRKIILIFSILTMLYLCSGCHNRTVFEVQSPDNKYNVIVEDSSGGATSGFVYSVMIEHKKGFLLKKKEKIYISDSISNPVWIDKITLQIQYEGKHEIYKQLYGYGEVNIEYVHVTDLLKSKE